jgi:hypothetical protein
MMAQWARREYKASQDLKARREMTVQLVHKELKA